MMGGLIDSGSVNGSSHISNDDYTEIKKIQTAATINCKTLINEIRQAVYEAQPKGDNTFNRKFDKLETKQKKNAKEII